MGNLLIPWHQVGIYQRSQAGFSNLHCYSDLNAPRERCLETRSVEFMRISPLPAIVNFAPPKKKSWNKQQSPNVAGDYLYCDPTFSGEWLGMLKFEYMASHFWNDGPVHGPTGSSHYTPTKSGPSRNTGQKYHLLKNYGWETTFLLEKAHVQRLCFAIFREGFWHYWKEG